MNDPSAIVQPRSFPAQAATFLIDGPVGRIEVASDVPTPEAARMGTAIVCHPHPLHGGTMDNKVVTMAERALRELGLHGVRFNYRGVGASEGVFDEGNGEMFDLLAVAEWVRSVRPNDELWLAGFSFGSFVSAKAVRHLKVAQLISIAPPVTKYPAFGALPHPECPWLVIQGDDDDVAPPQPVVDWIAQMPDPPQLVRMSGTGHFFHRKLMDLRGAIKNGVRANLPPLENPAAA